MGKISRLTSRVAVVKQSDDLVNVLVTFNGLWSVTWALEKTSVISVPFAHHSFKDVLSSIWNEFVPSTMTLSWQE